jgi:hypothetical protein
MSGTDPMELADGTAINGADLVVITATRDGQPFRQEADLPMCPTKWHTA